MIHSFNRLVVKPDQLIKRRGKLGLVGVDRDWTQVQQWIKEKMNSEVKVRMTLLD